MSRIVVALGGNALLRRGERPDADTQVERATATAAALRDLCSAHEVVVVHGNGPQVGMLAVENSADRALLHPFALDVLVGLTEGMIGYWLVQALRNARIRRPPVALLTQTVVGADDPAFERPTKFIGASYTESEAFELVARHGWHVAPDGGSWRRVVASPQPVRILESDVVAGLLAAGRTVVCAGGGGIAVVERAGCLRGVDAVVDKDYVAALLATELGADRLVILTDVDGVYQGWGTARRKLLRRIAPDRANAHRYPSGSMGPKVDAASRFVRAGGSSAHIGALERAADVAAGRSGTTFRGA